MNESHLTLSTSQSLQTFLLLSKSVKGKANSKLIMDALSARVFMYSQKLYEAPNVVEASSLPEVVPYYTLLRIFLYGTYQDYQDNRTQLPALTEQQTKKLKHLSIVSLSEHNQILSYDYLQQFLNIPTVRELEDLIIDAFYQGFITGKLDQRQRQLQVMHAMGRDLRPGQLDETVGALDSWSLRTSKLLGAMDAKIAQLQEAVQMNEIQKDTYQQQVEQLRKNIRKNNNLKKSPMDILQEDNKKKGYKGEYASPEYNDERSKKSRGPKRFMINRP